MKKLVRNLIIGEGVYIQSRTEFRQVMLSGQYALIALLVIAYYLVMEFSFGYFESQLVFCTAFGLIFYSLILHRQGKHCLANYFFFPTLNVLLYLVVSSESSSTGAAVFFIPVSLGALAVFNYQLRSIAVLLSILSFALFSFSVFIPFSLLPYRDYSESYIRLNAIINFGLAFPVSLMTVYLLISITHYNSTQLIESNQQLKKLNEELDRFVYSTSHDLRAPLLSVLGLLNIAEGYKDKEELQQYHRLMQSRVRALDKFIKDITDYSRNNRLEITSECVDIAIMADEIWESLRHSDDAKGIEFINELPKDLAVMNDGKRLRTVLSNLIANAIRYHDQRKEKKYIKIYHHSTDASFSLHIEDNGQGIAPEVHSKIFDMFYRGNELSQGSGLGLYIVKETLEKLSGTIQLSSIPKEGSTFSISVPNRLG
ncbi:MAG TPA: HAMP domain-containing sensor histidine kinase [Cyclobacteriaceae bacterium]|nr:HAMP domain-containing sensor histidine kinase [Cyclobacteriaceae bacterium]